MKVRIKSTGETINLASYDTLTLDKCDSYGDQIEVKPEDVELVQDDLEEYWNKFRMEAAKDILSGMMSQNIMYGNVDRKRLVSTAIDYADVLVKQLKERK